MRIVYERGDYGAGRAHGAVEGRSGKFSVWWDDEGNLLDAEQSFWTLRGTRVVRAVTGRKVRAELAEMTRRWARRRVVA